MPFSPAPAPHGLGKHRRGPRGVFESEFFGHVKGAFTDARSDRIGRFELADGGTIFLDEIGNVPLRQQAKLLRVLEAGELERVGPPRSCGWTFAWSPPPMPISGRLCFRPVS